jgi:sugar-phosphatase
MDGLLIDSEPLWHVAEVEIFGALGVPLARAETRSTKGMFVDEVARYWFERYPWSGPSTEEVAREIVSRVGELVLERGEPMAGAAETVERMAERGPVALASSTPTRLITLVLAHLGMEGRFSVICSAEDERYGKPHPAVFLSAAEALGVTAERCVVFEDSTAGVLAAKAAKMACVAVPEASDRGSKLIAIADLVLDSLEDLDLEVLDQLLAEAG